jgi:hypothetical protein
MAKTSKLALRASGGTVDAPALAAFMVRAPCEAKALLIASGSARRKLQVPGAAHGLG